MDLNQLYSQHQLSVMRAAEAPSRLARTRHLAAAGAFANRICNYQNALGAVASEGWLRAMDSDERPAACLAQ